MVKITFLGTGPSGRIPRPNCHWPVCEEASKLNSKSRRLQTSTFLEFEKTNILIDIGLDFEKQVELLGGKKIDFIFLTHGHSDAADGLPFLTLEKYQKRFNPIIYTEKHTFEVARRAMPEIAKLNFQFIEPYKKYSLENVDIIPFRVEHAFNPRFLTLGYLFEISGTRIVYASDFKIIPEQSKKFIKNADLAILDGAGFENLIPSHANFYDILKLSEELNFKKIYLTQVGIAWPPYEKAQEIVFQKAKNIFLSYDGLAIRFFH